MDAPLIDWNLLDRSLADITSGLRSLRESVGALKIDDLERVAVEHRTDICIAALAAGFISDLCGRFEGFLVDLRVALPDYARSLGQDPGWIGTCPRCGRGASLPQDGGPVACHRDCGYCSHPSAEMGRCLVCGARSGTLEWAERRSTGPGLTIPWPGTTGRVLMEKDGTGEPPEEG